MNEQLIKKSILCHWKTDENLSKLINIFNNRIEIFFVGGCVRDILLRQKLNEIDFAIDCKPQETIKILRENKIKYQDYGVNFGTVTALMNDKKFEITSLRKDIKTFGRFAKVEYTNSLEEDALRRDFTMNAIYVSVEGKIYNFFNGIKDIKDKKVLFIGETSKRIQEDYLRILRFYRFLSLFDNPNYLKKDLLLIENNISKIRIYISKNRIKNEIIKMLNNLYAKNSFTLCTQNEKNKKNILIKNIEKWWTKDKYESGMQIIKKCISKIDE